MKKLTKKSLDELAEIMPVISEKIQQECVGGTRSLFGSLWNATADGTNATYVNTGSGSFSGDEFICNYDTGSIIGDSFDGTGNLSGSGSDAPSAFTMSVDQLWTNSMDLGVESNAVILSNGQIIWLKSSQNSSDTSSWKCDNIRTNTVTGYSYYKISDTEIYKIVGTMHTHPNTDPEYQQPPTCYDDGRADDYTSLAQIGGKNTDVFGYVVGDVYVWKYYYDSDGNKREELVGLRSDFMGSDAP